MPTALQFCNLTVTKYLRLIMNDTKVKYNSVPVIVGMNVGSPLPHNNVLSGRKSITNVVLLKVWKF
jgi:hypothetical protein